MTVTVSQTYVAKHPFGNMRQLSKLCYLPLLLILLDRSTESLRIAQIYVP